MQSMLILPEQYVSGLLRTRVKEVGHEKINPEEKVISSDKMWVEFIFPSWLFKFQPVYHIQPTTRRGKYSLCQYLLLPAV